MSRASWQGKAVRTTICLDRKLDRWARQQMMLEGYNNNFSAFICDVVRNMKRKTEKHAKRR